MIRKLNFIKLSRILVIAFVIAVLTFISLPHIGVNAAPAGYSNYKTLTITGSADGVLSNYPIKFTIYKAAGTDSSTSVYLNGHCQDDFDDIRFYDATGTNPMDYYVEYYTSGTSAVVWVEFDSIAGAPATTDFRLYYNNPAAASGSNGTNTFTFFDDFSGGLGAWDTMPAAWAIVGGQLEADTADEARKNIVDANYCYYGATITKSADSSYRRIKITDAAVANYNSLWLDYSNNLTQFFKTGDSGGGTAAVTLSAGVAYRVAMKKSGSDWYLYINDTLKKSNAGFVDFNTERLVLVSEDVGATYFDNVFLATLTQNEPTVSAWATAEWDAYWVGASGNWNDASTEWAATSGGAAAVVYLPDAYCNVHFDANSFTAGGQSVSVNTTDAYCNDMDWTGVTNAPSYATDHHTLTISGSLVLDSNIASFGNGNGLLEFNSSGAETITSNGESWSFADAGVTFDGTGSWTLQDALTLGSDNLTLTQGTFASGGFAISGVDDFKISGVTSRTLTLGSSIVGCEDWVATTTTNLTFTANTATINDTGTFLGGSLTYGGTVNLSGNSITTTGNNTIVTLNMSGSSQTLGGNNTITTGTFTGGVVTLSGTNTFATLNITGTAVLNDTVNLGGNQTVTTTLNLDGNSQVNRLLIKSNTFGTARTLTLTGCTVSGCTNVDFYDITATPAIDLSAITGGCGDLGGNTGITFTTATSRYWVGNTGNWSDTTHWSATSGGAGGASMPLVQDVAYFDANSFTMTTRTVTVNVPYVGNIDSTDVINAPTIYSASTINSYGDLYMGANYWTATTATYFYGRDNPAVSVNGYTLTGDVYTYPYGTTLTLGSDFVTTGTLYHRAGTLDFLNFNVEAAYFDSSTTTYTRVLSLGSSTVVLDGTAATTKWNIDANNFTLSANTSMIVFTNSTANGQTFAGGAAVTTYYGLMIMGTGNYTTTFSVANTFTYIWIDRTDAAKTIAGNVTLTVSAFVIPVVGTTDITITNVDFSKASGTVVSDYLIISGSSAGGGASYFAGANSHDNGGNAGWVFTDSPAPIVSTLGGTDITDNSVVLNGNLDSLDGVTSGYVYFQYGLDTSYGSTTSLASISAVGAFDKSLGGLMSGTVYHYRAVFKYSGSSYAYGNDISFMTTSVAGAPLVSTGSASDVETTTATLNGSMISIGSFTVVYASFEYVYDTADYGTTDAMTTSETVLTAADGFTADITGLALGTTVHFRARVRFTVGVTSHYAYGGDVTFTTLSTAGGSLYPTITRGAVFCGYLQEALATGTLTNGTGIATGSPITLSAGLNTITVTQAGTFTVAIPSGNTGTAVSGGWVVTGSPQALTEGNNTVTVQAGGAGVIYITVGAGDMLFVAESFNTYLTLYYLYNPEKYFQVQLISTDGVTVLAATALQQWGLKPVSIYLDATQVQALGLVWGSAYYIGMVGMDSSYAPVITPYQLQPEDWYGDDLTQLDAWCINTATHMDTYYGYTYESGTSLLTDVTDLGTQLTEKGGGYFTDGIEGISSVRTDLFVSAKSKPIIPNDTANNAYDAAHTWSTMVGSVIAGDFTAFGSTVGTTGNTFAGWIIILLVMILSLIGFLFGDAKGLPTIVLCFPLVMLGSYLGACGIQWVVVPCIAMVMLFARQFWVKAT